MLPIEPSVVNVFVTVCGLGSVGSPPPPVIRVMSNVPVPSANNVPGFAPEVGDDAMAAWETVIETEPSGLIDAGLVIVVPG